MTTPLTETVVRFAPASTAFAEQLMRSLRRLDSSATARRRDWPAGADDLIAPSAEIPDRCTPYVHKPRERENQKNRHSEEQVRLAYRMRICDQRPGIRLQNKNTLCPIHEAHHLVAVEMAHGNRDCGQSKQKLSEED